MAKKKSKSKKPARDGFGLVGKHVAFKYRSAHPHGRVTGIKKQGKTRATTLFFIQPDAKDHHAGEPAKVVRHGDKIHAS